MFSIYSKNLTLSYFQNYIAVILCCQFNMSMNVSFFFSSLLFQLAGAKVQLFFNLASFFEKIFWLFFHDHFPIFLRTCTLRFFRFGSAKILPLLFIIQIFFQLFLNFFLICLTLSLCMNFFLNAGAKVEIFFVLTRLL